MIEPRYWLLLFVCMIAVGLSVPSEKYRTFGEPETQHEDFIEETETEPEKRQIRGQAVDLTAAEPETVTELVELPLETIPETVPETTKEPTTEPETVREQEPTEAPEEFPIYMVDGDVLDHDLQRFMWEELKIEGIEWWMPYTILTAYQESGFDVRDITNGVDMGLFNFREEYWGDRAARFGYPDADIFNPYIQTVVYVKMTAARIRQGHSIEEVISKHKQSDWGPFDQEYVNQVMDHELTRIR